MRIAIDAHALGNRLTGNERYIGNLIEQLLVVDQENEYLLFFDREEARREWKDRGKQVHTELVSSNPWIRLGLEFPRRLRRVRADVFHYQYTGPAWRVCPEVVTIHDMSFERHPDFYRPTERLRLHYTARRAAAVARRVITVSEFSKKEIIHFLGTPPEKIKVIYNGVSSEFRPATDRALIRKRLERLSVRQPYVLALGNVSRRKNHVAIVRGFAGWLSRRRDSEHRLVIAGKAENSMGELTQETERLGLSKDRLQILGYVAEEDIPGLYAGAETLVNMSVYEGFGLPLIEAMASGVPVIASRASCFPEIAGDAARLVDPIDPEDLAQAFEEILSGCVARAEWIGRGLQRAARFQWDTAARQTLTVYHEAAHGV
jgi:glycosyltransferase involved in cell wall biosynthesis